MYLLKYNSRLGIKIVPDISRSTGTRRTCDTPVEAPTNAIFTCWCGAQRNTSLVQKHVVQVFGFYLLISKMNSSNLYRIILQIERYFPNNVSHRL